MAGSIFASSEVTELQDRIKGFEETLTQSSFDLSAYSEQVERLSELNRQLENRLKESARQLDHEIQEIRRVEKYIERGKREWEATFDAVKDMIILCDQQFKIIRCNKSVSTYFKMSYPEIIDQDIDVLFQANKQDAISIIEKERKDVKFSVLKGWFDISVYPLVLSGETIGIVYLIKDVTERKLAQEILRESQEQLRKANDELEMRVWERTQELIEINQELQREIFERKSIQEILAKEKELLATTLLSIRDGVISTDKYGAIMVFNKAAEEITGWSQAEATGKSLAEVMQILSGASDEICPEPQEKLLGPKNKGDASAFDLQTLRTRDGNRALISATSAPVKDNLGKLVGYVVVFQDVTEKKRIEAQLALSQKMESIGQLAAGIAHEINTPMQYIGDNANFMNDAFQAITDAMQHYDELIKDNIHLQQNNLLDKIQAIRDEYDLDYYTSEIPEAISQSIDGIDRVRKIVLAMKAFSHPSNKMKQLSDINQGIETTVTISRNEWKYDADLEMELEEDLPLVYCEIDEINQVVLNMIINAVHAIQEKKARSGSNEKGTIAIRTLSDDELVYIQLEDTGTGIPKANLDRIFDPFFTTKEVGKGTGQGLSLAHSIIIQNHKGNITVDSEPGKGTIFTIHLPISNVDAVDEQEEE